MRRRAGLVQAVYWDASALISALLRDTHSPAARRAARDARAAHVVSSLALAEVHAVVARLERERAVTAAQADELQRRLARGPWRRTAVQPEAASLARLARRHPLRGADLWHLGAALALAKLLPGLRLLAFDDRLRAAADVEGLAR
jgi:predicted nucleic acid-binding protein